MKYQDALKFFADFGNVAADPDRLAAERPSEGALFAAVEHAVILKGQPRELANQARRAIVDHWGRHPMPGPIDRPPH